MDVYVSMVTAHSPCTFPWQHVLRQLNVYLYVSMATTLTLYMMVVRGNNIMATFSSIRALFTTFTITSNWSELMSTP